jgi:hypothetical protein
MSDENEFYVIKTVEGKRMVFDSKGNMVNGVIKTIEEQNTEMSYKGLSIVTVTLIMKSE